MAAVVSAAIAASQMILGGEHDQAGFKIKVAGAWLLRRNSIGLGAVKSHRALAADAGLVPRVRRDLREQGLGDFHPGAPARAFVGVGCAKLAFVRVAAQRTAGGLRRGHRLMAAEVASATASAAFARAPAAATQRLILRKASAGPLQLQNSGWSRWASSSVPFTTRGPGRLK